MQAKAMTAQVNCRNVERENPPVHSIANWLRDFSRMNPPIFTSAKTSKNPQEFVGEVHKILETMGATDTKKAELAFNQLKDVAHTWCKIWQYSCTFGGVLVTWELFLTSIHGEILFEREEGGEG